MKGVVWDDETLGAKYHDDRNSGRSLDQAKEYREKLIEAAVELDDDAMAAYLDGKEPDEATLKRLIRKAVITGAFFPVLCGSAFKNKGVQPLLDAVVDYLPSPLDVPPIKGIDAKRQRSRAQAGRQRADVAARLQDHGRSVRRHHHLLPHLFGHARRAAPACINSTKERKERIGRMLLMHANNREDIKEAYAGDIVALAGLKEVRTGDTLCDPQKPVILEKMEFPEPVIEIAIEPKSKADQEKLGVALAKLVAEDPSFRVTTDQEMRPDHPQGDGRAASRHQGRHPQAHLQGRRQYRRAAGGLSARRSPSRSQSTTRTRSRPAAPASSPRSRSSPSRCRPARGFEFENEIVGGAVPKEYIPGVEKGLESVLGAGVLAGFPVVDLKVALIDGRYHDVEFVGAGLRNRLARCLARGACRRAARCCSSRS